MRFHMFVAVAALAVIVGVSTAAAEEQGDSDGTPMAHDSGAEGLVMTLTNETFEDALNEYDVLLVDFYAPWCAGCRKLEPEYEEAAHTLLETHQLPGLGIAKVDATVFATLADDEGVRHYPTLFLYHNNTKTRLPPLNSGPAIVAEVRRQLGIGATPPVKRLEGVMEVSQWIFWRGNDYGRIDTSFVLYIPSKAPEEAVRVARDVLAEESVNWVDRVRFLEVEDDEVISAFSLPDDRPTMLLYTNFDEGRFNFSHEPTAERVREFLEVYTVPLVTPVDHHEINDYLSTHRTLILVFLPEQALVDDRVVVRQEKALRGLAKALDAAGVMARGTFTFLLVDGHTYEQWMSEFLLPEGKFPAIGVNDRKTGTMWKWQVPGAERVPPRGSEEEAQVHAEVFPDGSMKKENTEDDPFAGINEHGIRDPGPISPLAEQEIPLEELEQFLRRVVDGSEPPVVVGNELKRWVPEEASD